MDLKERGLSKKVYIGNIPYTANKEEVELLLRIVGPVISFELNYDKEAGKEKKHKGFGFCEYPDYETALSAIRNLNDLEFQSRCLKVGFETKAEQTMTGKGIKLDSIEFDPISFDSKNENKSLTEILGTLEKPQKYFIMRELKNIKELAESDLKNMLSMNPKLSQEILKMQNELGLDNIQQFEKKKTSDQISSFISKIDKKTKLIKKKSPKKTNSKLLTANLQEKKLPQKIMKEKQNIKDLSLHYQLHQDSLTNPTLLIPKDPIQHNFINDNLFNNTINPNRMFFNVNQTLMMDLQQTQNVNFQNEAIMNRGYVHKQHNIQGLGQNFMRNQQYANIQQYPSKPSIFNIQPEKEKNWNISESLNEKRDPFLNTNKIIFENEKIKKKLNQGYFKDNFQNQNKQMLNPYQNNQKNVFENKAENEFGNEPEFSPISPINFEFTEDLKNLILDNEQSETIR